MKTKRIVITGGPGSGKTSLINFLEEKGHACLSEVSRQVIIQAQSEGIEQLFLEDPILFSERLLQGRLKQFEEANKRNENFLFYDRGLPDITAYMDYLGTEYPTFFTKKCSEYKYDTIFLLPPWQEIYIQDNERYESFGQAEIIFEYLHKAYQSFGYDVHHVPVGSIEYRSEYIISQLKELY